MIAQDVWLRFFDVDLYVQIDSAEYLHRFLTLYDRFIIPKPSQLAPTQLHYIIVTQADEPYTILNGYRQPLPSPQWIADYLYNHILQATMAYVSSHLLFHAGVVSGNGRGIMIVADSFHGKTTLVMRLVQQGLRFLGDETAAIRLADGLLEPCLRRLNVRAGTLKLAGYATETSSTEIGDRLVIDLPTLKPNCAGEPVPLNYLFVLEDREHQIDTTRLLIVIDRLPTSMEQAVETLPHVTAVQIRRFEDCVRLAIQTRQQLETFDAFDKLCTTESILVLDVQTEVTHRPNFQTPVALRPINSSDAALELLPRFQSSYRSKLITEHFAGNVAQLYFETWQRIAAAECYALQVGNLEDMVAAIYRVAGLK